MDENSAHSVAIDPLFFLRDPYLGSTEFRRRQYLILSSSGSRARGQRYNLLHIASISTAFSSS
jgi:hypothetical protein